MTQTGSDDIYLVAAIDDIILKYESTYAELYLNELGSTATNFAISKTWEILISSFPVLDTIFEGVKFGKGCLDYLFNSDATAENNIKLLVLYNINAYAMSTVMDLRDVYVADKTPENANNFINGYLCYLSYQKYATEFSNNFVSEILFNGFWNHIKNMFSDQSQMTYEEFKQYFKNDMNYCERYNDFVCKYYEMYYAFVGYKNDMYSKDKISVTDVYFREYYVELGTEDDEFLFWNEAIVEPSNASNKSVKYTSSDEAVVSINSGNQMSLNINKVGTAVITATTEDGGYTDTYTINVVEGHGKDGSYLAPVATKIDSGKCGNNVYWSLYDNGLLRIIGSGEMYDYEYNEKAEDSWYFEKENIKSVIIGNGVTSIGKCAFSDCSNLTNIIIPESVTRIGESAFASCSSLTNISIPQGVKKIEDNTFYFCKGLTNILIPDGITSIGEFAFDNCNSLRNIKIPSSVTSIGKYAFFNCYSLSCDITIPDGITSIEPYTFADCNNLTKIIIPDSVTNIGYHAISCCRQMTEITIPDSVTYIGGSAFWGCSGLNEIIIPNSVSYIGSHAFSACENLTNVTISSSVTSIEPYTFNACRKLIKIVIPDSVTSIEYRAFKECTNLSEIVIPDSVVSIGEYAFQDCSSLTSITVPTSITRIEGYTFTGCTSLAEVVIPNSVTSIGWYAFQNCSSLTNITIPENITTISSFVFSGCSSLTEIKIPENVTRIGSRAFWGCSSLKEIKIPSGVTSIESGVFSGCDSLTEIEIPLGVTTIDHFAFAHCDNLKKVTIPSGVISIGIEAFSGCSSLTEITIPASVTSIEGYAFYDCKALKNVTIYSKSVEFIKGQWIFWYSPNVTLIGYPGSMVETFAKTYNKPFIPITEIDDLKIQLEDAEQGAVMNVNLESTTVLPKIVLDMIKEKNLTLNLTLNNIATWVIKGANISSNELSDIDLSVTRISKDAGNISANMITALAGNRIVEQLIFAQEGSFGMVGELSLSVSDGIDEEKGVLLQALASDGNLKLIDSALIKSNTITFDVNQGVDSVIVYGTNGDIDGDGTVTIKDVIQMLNYISNRESLNELQKGFADVDMNGSVNIQDLMRALYYVSGRNTYLYEMN